MTTEYVVLGATGHVGSAVARTLLERGERVIAVSRDREKAQRLEALGAEIATVDVHDVPALRGVLRRGRRLFLLNPPAPPSTDAVAEERRSLAAILKALEGSGLKRIVAESTYGAQPGERISDLGVLYEMEQSLAAGTIPVGIVRGAYYMSNWDHAVESARSEGTVPSLFPAEFRLPMVAPKDLGRFAAGLLTQPDDPSGVRPFEGPQRYSSADVARALGMALRRPVTAVETPRESWIPALRSMGFSEISAESMASMTAVTLKGDFDPPERAVRGETTIEAYFADLVRPSGQNVA